MVETTSASAISIPSTTNNKKSVLIYLAMYLVTTLSSKAKPANRDELKKGEKKFIGQKNG